MRSNEAIKFLASILKREKICSDISPLSNCFNNGKYRVEELKFNINEVPRNTKPNVELLEVILDVSYNETEDDIPISNYCFRVTAQGIDHNLKIIKSSWHLDYDCDNSQAYIHPYFHLTWGGNAIKSLNLGDLLLLPTPRISYPPMDIVLGIDFILSNFIKSNIYSRIQSDSYYRAAVKNAQSRFWKPYILSLAHHWCNNQCSLDQYKTISCKQFYPTLID